MFYTNADQLMNKRDELRARLNLLNTPPSILAFTEVNPKNMRFSIAPSELTIEGYQPPVYSEQGRGIAVYVAKGIDFSPISCDEFAVSINIPLKGSDKLCLACLYRSPSNTEDQNLRFLQSIRATATTPHTHLALLGDFNLPKVNWSTLSSPDPFESTVLETMKELSLHQHVTCPTRFRHGQKPSTLDLVWTNEQDMIDPLSIKTYPGLGKSDHNVLTLSYCCYSPQRTVTRPIKNYKRANYMAMSADLNMDWGTVLANRNCEESWNFFCDELSETVEQHIPQFTPNPNRRLKPAWMSQTTRDKIKNKNRTWANYQRNPTEDNYKAYAKARNQTKCSVRKDKKLQEQTIASCVRTNPKPF